MQDISASLAPHRESNDLISRISPLNERPYRTSADYVLYWSQMNRRATSNHALEHAVDLANHFGLPTLFYEGLTCDYPHASDRLHTFILQGVEDTARELKRRGIGYIFYLRRKNSDPNDVLYRLARSAAAVVTDDYPVFLTAQQNPRVAARLDVAFEAVDSSCIVPMRSFEKQEWAAYTIRPKIRKLLPDYIKPLRATRVAHKFDLTAGVEFHTSVTAADVPHLVASCDIDHSVQPCPDHPGGSRAARRRLRGFLEKSLHRYARERNEPTAHATSGLSPYLHFGHISALEIALAVRDYAAEHKLIADEYLEELIVRRELAFNFARFSPSITTFEGLPEWARKTMSDHRNDKREPSYTAHQFERAETHDPLWNAAQKELLLRGTIHGYYRMYWGKKIIEWSPTYEEALATMIRLNDRYALDGRDPNTYTNILWCFGLHDRPWPEHPIAGKMRTMSIGGMRRKTDVEAYIKEIERLEARAT